MSRIIKFRAWHSDFGEMVYSSPTWGYGKREFTPFIFQVGFSHYPESEWDIMQFTGQEDAMINGEEVYESDIIENCDTKALQVVYWNEDKSAWYCRYVEDEKRIVSLSDSLGNLNKKVGNIYQNHELLNQSSNTKKPTQ